MDTLKPASDIKKTTLNLTGHTFGNLTVLSFSHYYKKYTLWNCSCTCGNQIKAMQKDLFSGLVTNCGCNQISATLNKAIPKPHANNKCGITGVYFDKKTKLWNVAITYKKITYSIGTYQNFDYAVNARLKAEEVVKIIKAEDLKNNPPQRRNKTPLRNLVGEKFGKLTVLSLAKSERYVSWHCKCDCGNEKDILQHNLLNGKACSCGCQQKKVAKEHSQKYMHVYKGIQIEKSMAKSTPKNNTSGFRGVNLDKKSGKYRARMILQGVRYELGYFTNFEDAKKARLIAEEKRDAIVEEYFNNLKTQNQ